MTSKKPKLAKLMRARELVAGALSEFRAYWKRYVAIMTVIAVPVGLLGLSSTLSKDQTISGYVIFALFAMYAALVWGMAHREENGVVPRPLEAYYEGSVALIRLIIVSILIVFMFIPAILGTLIYLMSLISVEPGTSQTAARVLIDLIALMLGTVTAWLVMRFALAPLVVVADGLRPLDALRYARQLTLGYFWQIVRRVAVLLLLLLIVAVPLTLITVILYFIKVPQVLCDVIFQILATVVMLPIANIYLLRLYRDLENKAEVA